MIVVFFNVNYNQKGEVSKILMLDAIVACFTMPKTPIYDYIHDQVHNHLGYPRLHNYLIKQDMLHRTSSCVVANMDMTSDFCNYNCEEC